MCYRLAFFESFKESSENFEEVLVCELNKTNWEISLENW